MCVCVFCVMCVYYNNMRVCVCILSKCVLCSSHSRVHSPLRQTFTHNALAFYGKYNRLYDYILCAPMNHDRPSVLTHITNFEFRFFFVLYENRIVCTCVFILVTSKCILCSSHSKFTLPCTRSPSPKIITIHIQLYIRYSMHRGAL